jgi:hypothetical protein
VNSRIKFPVRMNCLSRTTPVLQSSSGLRSRIAMAFGLSVLLSVLALCDTDPPAGPEPLVDRMSEGTKLEIVRRAAYDSNRSLLELENRPELDAVDARLQSLFTMIDERNLTGLPGMVYPAEGVFIDLKAHRTMDQLKSELEQPAGYFEKFYLNSQLLRDETRDQGQVSLHELLNQNARVYTEYFLEPGGTQIEVRFFPGSTPDEAFRLNNAVFILRENTWYFLQLP